MLATLSYLFSLWHCLHSRRLTLFLALVGASVTLLAAACADNPEPVPTPTPAPATSLPQDWQATGSWYRNTALEQRMAGYGEEQRLGDFEVRAATMDAEPSPEGADFSYSLACVYDRTAAEPFVYLTAYSAEPPAGGDVYAYAMSVEGGGGSGWTDWRAAELNDDGSALYVFNRITLRSDLDLLRSAAAGAQTLTAQIRAGGDGERFVAEFGPGGVDEALGYLGCFAWAEPASE